MCTVFNLHLLRAHLSKGFNLLILVQKMWTANKKLLREARWCNQLIKHNFWYLSMLRENTLHVKIPLHPRFQNQHFNWQVQSHKVQNCSAFSQYNVESRRAKPIETCSLFYWTCCTWNGFINSIIRCIYKVKMKLQTTTAWTSLLFWKSMLNLGR